MRQQLNTPSKSLVSLASLAFAVLILACFSLVFASGARAVIDDGWQAWYTTEDLCELTLSPADTATLNANGTQTFTVKIGPSQTMQAVFDEFGLPPRPSGLSPEELPESISYWDAADACIYGEIVNLTGLYVKFEVISGPDAGKVFETEIAADGTATFPLTNNGALGTDQVRATVQLPQICLYAMRDVGIDDPWEWSVYSQGECEEFFGPVPEARVRPVDFGTLDPVTLVAAGSVNWIAPPPVVAQGAVSVTSFKSCVSNRIRIRPRYSSGLRSARLVVDGKTVQTKKSTAAFILNPSKYKAGKHRFKVVATYDSGNVTSNTGSFSKCKAKVSVKKVKPKFTG